MYGYNSNRASKMNCFAFLVAAGVAIIFASPALARLGTFIPADGYQHLTAIPPGSGGYSWSDVAYYNAGDHGANAGGGSLTFLPHNTGNRWRLVSSLGSFYPDAATRTAAVGTYPPYPFLPPPSGVAAYMVGGHFGGRTDNYNLAFRNDTGVGPGPVVYDYYLDSYDLGANPASITSGNVETQFYFRPTLPKAPVQGSDGTLINPDKFHLSFMDTNDNIGFQWGYAKNNEVYWRTNTSGPWTYTGIIAADQSANLWDGVKVDIDLSSDTFQLDYYDVGTNTWSNIVPVGTPLGMSLQDFTKLRWQLEDDGGTFFAGKEYFDDFTFSTPQIPEPSSIALACLGLVGIAIAAKRNRK